MEYIIVAFKSRSHTIKFYNMLMALNIRSEIVNTPKQAGVGCGLSVKLNKHHLNSVRKAVQLSGLCSFSGIFTITSIGTDYFVRPI